MDNVRLLTVGLLLCSGSGGFLLHGDVSRCPPGRPRSRWLFPFRDTCVEFVTDKQDYWDDASDVCRSRGGHLVVIPDAGTQAFLMAALRSRGYQGKRLWIGLSDSAKEHHWRWITGSPLSGYSHFSPGENDDNILHWSQDCVFIHYGDQGRWHDNACHFWPEYFNYICQYDMLPLPTTTTKRTTTTTQTTATQSTTTPTTPMTSSMTTPGCQDTNCLQQCPHGYAGLLVGSDGCVQCRCN